MTPRSLRSQVSWLYHQRARWLVALIFLALLVSLLTRFPRAKERQPSPPYAGPIETLEESAVNGFLSLSEAQDFCQRRRWKPYATRNHRRKVYDLFLINTELDVLEIRLNELDQEVDFFVILESASTFQMNPKPLHLKNNLSQFDKFKHKIIHQVLDDSGAKNIPKDDTWKHETFTRNALLNQVMSSLTGDQAPTQGDVLLIGDIDEIPRIGTLTALRNCAFPPRVTLRTQMYYYSYQWLHRGELWHHPQATYYDGPVNTVKPDSLRMDAPDTELYMSGWHCSSCFGTMDELKTKITSFSHKGYNHPYILDNERLLQAIRRGEDLFERESEMYDRVDNNTDIPEYLKTAENRQKFAYMLDRDPRNANLMDV